MTASEPFWRAPRRLRCLLENGDLTLTQYALLHYVGEAGGDRERFATSQGFLAELFDVSAKTIQRGLKKLRDLRLIEHDLVSGKSVFHIWLGPEALVVEANPEANLGHPSDTTSDTPRTQEAPPMSEVTSDTPPPPKTRKPAPAKGQSRDVTSDSSRAGAETETETETKTKPPDVGGNKERRAREDGAADVDTAHQTSVSEPDDRRAAVEEQEPADNEPEPEFDPNNPFAVMKEETEQRIAAKANGAAGVRRRGGYVPADRVVALVAPKVSRDSVAAVASRAGIAEDTLLRILRGKRKRLQFDTADSLLTATGQTHVWHLDPPDGLADLYGVSR